ncbi:electroneutral sodium bicarbonate exchanger 1-like, partial [Tropilaelaps mercedesae]
RDPGALTTHPSYTDKDFEGHRAHTVYVGLHVPGYRRRASASGPSGHHRRLDVSSSEFCRVGGIDETCDIARVCCVLKQQKLDRPIHSNVEAFLRRKAFVADWIGTEIDSAKRFSRGFCSIRSRFCPIVRVSRDGCAGGCDADAALKMTKRCMGHVIDVMGRVIDTMDVARPNGRVRPLHQAIG